MNPLHETFKYKKIELEYKWTTPKRDRRHLVVVFSGGFIGGYDFDGESFSRLGCSILWIRDRDNSYYMRKHGDNSHESAVQELIRQFIDMLGLNKDQVTLLGTSKGGGAALYHGLRYEFRNIVASVPRIYPAKGNLSERPQIISEILGGLNDDLISEFDSLIPNALHQSTPQKNLFIITSQNDIQYETEIVPNLALFRRFTNFNLIETDSTNVRQHEDVTLYNLPIIVSIISQLIDGITPKFGEIKNGAKSLHGYSLPQKKIASLVDVPVVSIDSVDLSPNGLLLRGRAFLMYQDCPEYGDVQRRLVLVDRNAGRTHHYFLGGIKDRRNNRDYEQETGNDYTAGSYATKGNRPQDLSDLPFGNYEVGIEIAQAGNVVQEFTLKGSNVSFYRAFTDSLIQINMNNGKLQIVKMPLADYGEYSGVVSIDNIHFTGGRLYIEGACSLSNTTAENWASVQFKLILQSIHSNEVISVNLAKQKQTRPMYPWRNPRVSEFTTHQRKGIELPNLAVGEYRILLAPSIDGYVFVHNSHLMLSVQSNVKASILHDYNPTLKSS